MSRLYELPLDKNTWMKRLNYLIVGFVMVPLIICIVTAEKCEYQRHIVKDKEGIYVKNL